MFTSEYESYNDVDHLVLNEGEITIPAFLDDLKNGPSKAFVYFKGMGEFM